MILTLPNNIPGITAGPVALCGLMSSSSFRTSYLIAAPCLKVEYLADYGGMACLPRIKSFLNPDGPCSDTSNSMS